MNSSKLLSKIILACNDTYNGHNQWDSGLKLTVKEIASLCEMLQEELYISTSFKGFVIYELYSDGCGVIKAQNYWADGEHELGHRDKNLISIGWEK